MRGRVLWLVIIGVALKVPINDLDVIGKELCQGSSHRRASSDQMFFLGIFTEKMKVEKRKTKLLFKGHSERWRKCRNIVFLSVSNQILRISLSIVISDEDIRSICGRIKAGWSSFHRCITQCCLSN